MDAKDSMKVSKLKTMVSEACMVREVRLYLDAAYEIDKFLVQRFPRKLMEKFKLHRVEIGDEAKSAYLVNVPDKGAELFNLTTKPHGSMRPRPGMFNRKVFIVEYLEYMSTMCTVLAYYERWRIFNGETIIRPKSWELHPIDMETRA